METIAYKLCHNQRNYDFEYDMIDKDIKVHVFTRFFVACLPELRLYN